MNDNYERSVYCEEDGSRINAYRECVRDYSGSTNATDMKAERGDVVGRQGNVIHVKF